MAISSLGIGSGLDLNQIVNDLVNAERVPKETRFNQREQRLEAQISAYGNLTSAIDQAKGALSQLSEFELSQNASVSNRDVARVTADGTAANGDFSLEVTKLAQAQALASAPGEFADADAEVGAGQLAIQVGDGDAFTVNVQEGDTLRDVRNAINDAEGGVTASIVNDGDGARLVLTANTTGEANTINVTATEDPVGSGLARLDGANLVQTRAAQDAEAVINGLTVTSTTNTLEDTVEGLSIELRGTSDSPVTVSVSEDQGALQRALEGFVEAYNGLIGQTSNLTAYNAEEQQASVLTGDSTVRGIRSRLGNALVEPAQIPDVNARTLASLGVVSNRDGTLGFDSDRFNQALENDGFDNVTAVVREIGERMEGVASSFTGPDGLIGVRTEGLQNDLERLSQQRVDLNVRLEQLESRLVRQFGRMDSTVAQLQGTSDFLMGQLANMPLAQNNSRR